MNGRNIPSLPIIRQDSILFGVLLLLGSIAVCILLIVFFVLPQIDRFIAQNTQIKETRERIQVMRTNIQTVNSLDPNIISDNFVTTNLALPPQRAYSNAMQGILSAAVQSGISLKSFTFSVGVIASRSATPVEDPPPMDIEIEALGEAGSIKDFIASLYSFLPLSKITKADSAVGLSGATKISVSFPSKPLASIAFEKSQPLPQMTDKQRELLQKLQEWKDNTQRVSTESEASTSADLPAPF